MIRAAVRGVGHYLPDRVVPNAEFEAIVDTSDEWIRSRSGIERRHFAAEGQLTSDLATRAATAALADAGLDATQIDAIIVATSTPDLSAWHDLGLRLRRPGRLCRIRLRHGQRQRADPLGPGDAGAGDRRRNLLAPDELEGPRHLRPFR